MSESRWKVIKEALLGRRSSFAIRDRSRLEELVAIVKRAKSVPTERIEPSEVLMRRSELLYRLEPLIFSAVNKLTRRMTGTNIYFTGPNQEENMKATRLAETSGLLRLLPSLVKDALIYGFGVAEIIKDGSDWRLQQLDPKEFDFQRDGSEIKIGNDGKIAGYVWKHRLEEQEFKPEDVLLIRFYTLGEHCLGISPVEAAFRSAWIKLNLEEALGEAIFRRGFPLLKIKIGSPEPTHPFHDITPEKIKEAKKILTNLESASELILPWWMDAEPVNIRGQLGNIHEFIQLLSMEILAAFEMPKGFGVSTGPVGGRAVEELDFEKTIVAFQEELKRQIEEQFLIPYYKANNFETRPSMVFTEYSPELQNVKLRRLSAYAKYGLITRTDELENALRQQEGFPLKEKKRVGLDQDACLFGLGLCPIRQEENVPLDKLVTFCNICILRLREEQRLKTSEAKTQA